MTEQLEMFNTAKYCPQHRKKRDVKPKGFYTCAKCGGYLYAE
jgi:hypothetical protein